jgi:uncharacterized protein YhbP (UPF0306 family)
VVSRRGVCWNPDPNEVPIERSNRPVGVARIRTAAQRLLDASTLCAIATVSPRNRAHVNTAYFAWSRDFDIVWLSEPDSGHSRNLRQNSSAAIAVYDSVQVWGSPDRGIQLFGSAREVLGRTAGEAERLYAARFPEAGAADLRAYRFYRLRPLRMKLFDEPVLGRGVFVTATVRSGGRITWKRTELYSPEA